MMNNIRNKTLICTKCRNIQLLKEQIEDKDRNTMIKRQYKDIILFKGTVLRLLQLQMRISFPFLRAKDLRRFLLIVRTHSF